MDKNGVKNNISDNSILHYAAIIIQKNWKGYYVRQRFKNQLKYEPIISKNEMNEEKHFLEIENNEISEEEEEKEDIETFVNTNEKIDKETRYTITIKVGNRWGSDFTENIYIILHGENFDSSFFELTQDVSFFMFSIIFSMNHGYETQIPNFKQIRYNFEKNFL